MGNMIQKHKQLISYVLWSCTNTVVNYTVYFLCTRVFHVPYLSANVIAWVITVLYAFVINKCFVFRSPRWTPDAMLPELGKFVGARVFSGAVETGLLWLCVDIAGIHDGISKVLTSIVGVILNYLFSKLFIFRTRR